MSNASMTDTVLIEETRSNASMTDAVLRGNTGRVTSV